MTYQEAEAKVRKIGEQITALRKEQEKAIEEFARGRKVTVKGFGESDTSTQLDDRVVVAVLRRVWGVTDYYSQTTPPGRGIPPLPGDLGDLDFGGFFPPTLIP